MPENHLPQIALLEVITEQLAAAIESEDLDAFENALVARRRALESVTSSGLSTSPAELASAYEAGERALAALFDLKLHLQAEHGRLAQVRKGFLDFPEPANQFELRA
jgi:hypothetical protein